MKLVYTNPVGCNSTNHYEMAPFKFNGNDLVLDKEYYTTIKDTWLDKTLRKDFPHVWVEDNVIYGEKNPCNKFFNVYHRNYEFYFADHWAHVIPDMYIIRYSNDEAKNMENRDYLKLSGLIERLDLAIQKCINVSTCTGAFVKLGSSSTKHDYPPEQVFNGEDALKHLLGSDRVMRFISCGVIVVRRWRNDITRINEFRVFIKSHKVIGVSQQFIFETIPFSYETIYHEVINDIQKLWDNIKDKVEYNDAILDIWLDYNMKPQLIEINPYGPWTGAGSSLFHWVDDPVEKKEVEFRITEWISN